MSSTHFKDFLKNSSSKPLRVLNPDIPNSKYIPIDLSVNNAQLHTLDVSKVSVLQNYIQNQVNQHSGLLAYGGYNEVRDIYKRSHHFNENGATERNIHLGVDLWIAAETPIFCPLDAIVHSFKNNTNFGDYGPTIILKHTINEVEFNTLYGHLSLASLNNIETGKPIRQGEPFATLGDTTVNGDYPPHLHFQIIKDLQGYKGDYPGVCNKKDLEFYLDNCPNPEVLLRLEL
ncbi:peptidoglycan DD-metalloendopeptidase family protein [Confluentibacter flavum]|uniref:Peptidase M23 n=1 Tax=Confluentibacter flavum TaxID=1909700 RepID=A0A2N3HIX5_9FLAO|nr:peptidoglycan DD-metalloendopeptidase family protein [Confluentibacter flavum]PKQ44842.1 peptidase M23 [Confluentibacter flavum]